MADQFNDLNNRVRMSEDIEQTIANAIEALAEVAGQLADECEDECGENETTIGLEHLNELLEDAAHFASEMAEKVGH